MAGAVRVRFAPSPTGSFHVGSARTALFNWLFARHHGGTFLLRIEDTDAERNREDWVGGILDALAWLGLEPDEAPVRQSAMVERHQEAIDRLLRAGLLYACDCRREDVEARKPPGTPPGYDGHCRDRGLEPGPGRVLRFKVPDAGEVVVEDVVRGTVRFPLAAIEDFAVVKSTGQPLFVLANVVDDLAMGISHVVRGEDLLPSTPKQVLLWGALAGPARPLPIYAHLPMLVNEKRQKLSKRRDPVAVEQYRAEGYLPEAFVNYLALLGWSHPSGRELLSREELVAAFRLEDVNHAPAFFDVQKLRHLNGEHLRRLPLGAFVEACRPYLTPPSAPWPAERFDPAVFEAMAPLVQERVAVLSEVPGMVDFLFLPDPPLEAAAWAQVVADPLTPAILGGALEAYADCPFEPEALHQATAALAESLGRKLGKAQAPIRVAVTGRRVGPPLFESLALLGREETLRRLRTAQARLAAEQPAG
ncbi:glutamate--tRNA ligase [Aciditerrimonas ferrireducens]|uniref:Glutamate--tRNA ligase n=1 Tax=Aciditerrimonas ferrireducens TaxID=667306 RepID=A0ABV6C143_9ACTN